MKKTVIAMMMGVALVSLGGCKYYGSALPPDYPMSMDDAYDVARDHSYGSDVANRQMVRRTMRPRVEQPSYLPEKEMALVAPPRTLLVWSYPHVTDDNTRVFGSWSTVFLRERYEWVPPSNEVPESDMVPAAAPYLSKITGETYAE